MRRLRISIIIAFITAEEKRIERVNVFPYSYLATTVIRFICTLQWPIYNIETVTLIVLSKSVTRYYNLSTYHLYVFKNEGSFCLYRIKLRQRNLRFVSTMRSLFDFNPFFPPFLSTGNRIGHY